MLLHRWLMGAKGGKLKGTFPAMALWPKAPATMKAKYEVNVADIQFGKNEWVSNWVRGRLMGLELGHFTKTSARWSEATREQIAKAEAEKDGPFRFQVKTTLSIAILGGI